MHSGLHVSATDPRPLYLQLIEQMQRRIAVGDWPPGKELPSIRALAAELRVSVITIKRAYEDLEALGVIETRHGKGSFVAARAAPAATDQLEQQLGEHLAAAAELAHQLGLDERELAARLARARKGKGTKS